MAHNKHVHCNILVCILCLVENCYQKEQMVPYELDSVCQFVHQFGLWTWLVKFAQHHVSSGVKCEVLRSFQSRKEGSDFLCV